jgi:hypothetical protein
MELTQRNIVTGLEGCGKSSTLFTYLETVATPEAPVLYAVKNYKLMTEQVLNWSNRFNIPFDHFNICGFGKTYEPALDAYTNPDMPYMLGKNARFVFTSQALVQRGNHLRFVTEEGDYVKFAHVVVDEFDFVSGIIPSLDYEIGNMQLDNIKTITIEKKLNWIESNYSFKDRVNLMVALKHHKSEFVFADWIESCECPLTFLSSEKLVALLFGTVGFNVIKLGVDNFDHEVCVFASEHITGKFFDVMNQNVAWNTLDYDLIISDCINSHFENNKEALKVSAISHMGIRGSNAHKGKKVLTILSHIPQQSIVLIKDALNYLGCSIEYADVARMFYRDRLCQAVGRVIGYRASSTEAATYVVMHSTIYNALYKKDFPYNLVDWEFDLTDKAAIFETVSKKKKAAREYAKVAVDYSYLNEFFYSDSSAVFPVADLKTFMLANHIKSVPATKLAKLFNGVITNTYIKRRPVRIIKGVGLKK